MSSAYLNALSKVRDPKVLFIEIVKLHGGMSAVRGWVFETEREMRELRPAIGLYERGKLAAALEVRRITEGNVTTEAGIAKKS